MFQVIHERINIEGDKIVKYRQAIGPYFAYQGAADKFASILQSAVIQERANIGDCTLCKSAEGVFISDIECLETCECYACCGRYSPVVETQPVLIEGNKAHRVRCANGVIEDGMHDTFVVVECKP